MKTFIAALVAASFAVSANAELMLKSSDGSQELRLYESLCSHGETLSHIPEEFRDRFFNARILDKHGTIVAYGCFAEVDGTVLAIFEDGSRAILELSKFKESSI